MNFILTYTISFLSLLIYIYKKYIIEDKTAIYNILIVTYRWKIIYSVVYILIKLKETFTNHKVCSNLRFPNI